MIITDPKLPDNPIVFANEAFQKLTGYPRDELLGRNCRFLQCPDTDPAAPSDRWHSRILGPVFYPSALIVLALVFASFLVPEAMETLTFSTPSTLPAAPSILAAQEAQSMPVTR